MTVAEARRIFYAAIIAEVVPHWRRMWRHNQIERGGA